MKTTLAAVIAAGFALAAGAASADVLASVTPNDSLEGTFSNQAVSQNFLIGVTFATDVTVDGFGIYTSPSFAALGFDTTLRIRQDNGGAPAAANLFELDQLIDSLTTIDDSTVLASVHVAPIGLSAGTYWFGLSGTSSELGWDSYNYGVNQPLNQFQLSGESAGFQPFVGNFAFEVDGNDGAGVPEPATWALMLGGFGLAGAALRRRRATATA